MLPFRQELLFCRILLTSIYTYTLFTYRRYHTCFGLLPVSQPAFLKAKDDADGQVGKKSGACTVLVYLTFGQSPHSSTSFAFLFHETFFPFCYSKLFSCQPPVVPFACQVDESDGLFLGRGTLVSQ